MFYWFNASISCTLYLFLFIFCKSLYKYIFIIRLWVPLQAKGLPPLFLHFPVHCVLGNPLRNRLTHLAISFWASRLALDKNILCIIFLILFIYHNYVCLWLHYEVPLFIPAIISFPRFSGKNCQVRYDCQKAKRENYLQSRYLSFSVYWIFSSFLVCNKIYCMVQFIHSRLCQFAHKKRKRKLCAFQLAANTE